MSDAAVDDQFSQSEKQDDNWQQVQGTGADGSDGGFQQEERGSSVPNESGPALSHDGEAVSNEQQI